MTHAIIAVSNALHIDALLDFFRSINKKLEHRAQVNATIKELSRLSDRELNDIGIARGDIWSIAHEDASFKRYAETNKNLKGWV